MTKRPDGTLEHDIMAVLWSAEGPLQPGDIRDRLQVDLAYTSVATVLSRLQAKGLVSRSEAGRAFVYEAAFDESQLAVRRIGEVYNAVTDKRSVLAGFLGTLSTKDVAALRTMLGEDIG